MSRPAAPQPLAAAYAGRAVLAGAAASLPLVLMAFLAPRQALAGWLIAWLFWGGIAIGGLALLLVHALTGGRWLGLAAPPLLPVVRTLPLFVPLFIPVALGLRALYPWAADPAATSPSVAHLYLNPPLFLARAATALLGWSLLSVLVRRLFGPRREPMAGLGLAFHGLVVSLVAVDWVLSVDPRFTSTAFAADFALTQILSALAWTALTQTGTAAPGREGDLAALLLAAILGTFYLGLMQYLVPWYGDLPDKAAWYLRRGDGWSWLALAGLALATLLPTAALLLRPVRRSARRLRRVGALVLLGVLCRTAWLLAPEYGAASLLAAALALVAIGGLWLGLAYGPWLPALLLRRREMARGV